MDIHLTQCPNRYITGYLIRYPTGYPIRYLTGFPIRYLTGYPTPCLAIVWFSRFIGNFACLSCDGKWDEHLVLYEDEELRKELGKPVGDAFYPLSDVPEIQQEFLKQLEQEEEKAKKHIEELMKSKLLSAEGQVRSNERKILEEIEARAIDLSIEKVREKLSKSLSGNDYDKHFDSSIQSIEKGLKQVYS